ncbi:hypothetical protein PybrP1_011947 [[Pythium] brassicae (nom. inval.)]|nr:hypothetical protein PybrP1_011947 [[Pythium] brassicae (nom. inval.)]
MAGKFGGRVFAGEDSEEEEEEDEIQYSFQFSSSGLSAPAPVAAPVAAFAAPRFSAPAPVAANTEGSEEDESDEDVLPPSASTAAAATPPPLVVTPAHAGGEESEDDNSDEDVHALVGSLQGLGGGGLMSEESPRTRTPTAQQKSATPTAKAVAAESKATAAAAAEPLATPALHVLTHQKPGVEADDAHWELVKEVDGVQVMGDAIVSRMQPTLDDAIMRIAELTESQQHLLQLLASQHASICENEQIKRVAVVMDKLPHYIRKVQTIKAAMAEISASVEKMKKRGESLRVDAQSHAIKKETKRDSMAQWNKMHAGRSSEQSAANSAAK